MALQDELGLKNPIQCITHEAVLNVVLTGVLLAKEGTRVLRPLGLTEAQLNVLMLLRYQSEDDCLSQSSLSQMLVVNRSNVTGLVDRMEEAGWVERTPDKDDRRIKHVCLTAEGARVLERAEASYLHRIDELTQDVSEEKCAALCAMLEAMRRRLHYVPSNGVEVSDEEAERMSAAVSDRGE